MKANDLPRRFLSSINAQGEYVFYPLTALQIERANFLDIQNLNLKDVVPVRIRVQDYVAPEKGYPLCYIFHTAFCGSTLLSRALSQAPKTVVLKEPDVLMKISNQSLISGNESVIPYLQDSLKELSQPWVENGKVAIKPTNSVNRIIREILYAYPGKAVLLYSELEDFLVSCFKKLPTAEQKLRWMAQHLIHQTRLQKKLKIETLHPFGFIEACIITWYSQMEYFAKAIEDDIYDNIRTLNMKDMLEKPLESVQAASLFLGLEKSDTELAVGVTREFNRNSKATGRPYTNVDRSFEISQVKTQYSLALTAALEWAELNIAPIAIVPTQNKPLIS
jgi:hypothetical protein